MESPVWNDPHYLKIWMYCLMKASHKKREILIGNQIVNLEPGQFITGRKSLSDDLNKDMKPKQRQSEISWWRYLNNLSKWEMLNIKKTNKYSVISINKWCDYQESEQQMNNKRTTDEQQLNTNKNVKNVKNDKEVISSSSDPNFSEVFQFYQSNLQKGVSESSYNNDLIIQWFDEWGHELLIAAMKVAAKKEAKGVTFVEGILKNWKEAGVKTIEDARKYQTEFNANKKSSYSNNIVNIPNAGKDDMYAENDEQDSKGSRHVRLYK